MNCRICNNNENFRPLFPHLCSTNNYLCDSCGHVFIDTSESMGDYYKDDGYFEKSPNLGLRENIVTKPLMLALGQKRLNTLEENINFDFENKRVLDVGCAYGQILHAIRKKYGSDVLGIEPSKRIAEIGKSYFDIEILPILLEELDGAEKFDIILCNHTLEHVDDPHLFIKSMRDLLTDDGVLYIEVPNIMSPTGGFPLETFLYNEHLNTFSESTLEELLNDCGMEVVEYNSDKFLMFLAKRSASQSPKKITNNVQPDDIYDFLTEYNESYGLSNYLNMYLGKLDYLGLVIKSKFKDVLK